MVETDLFHFQGKNYVMIVNYFSKFIEFVMIPKLTSLNTINAIKSYFLDMEYLILLDLMGEGGGVTQYTSEKFQKFVKEWQIEHIVSSPTNAVKWNG